MASDLSARVSRRAQGELALPLLLLIAQQRSIIAASPLDDEAEVPEQLKTTAENFDRCQEVLGQVRPRSRSRLSGCDR